MATDLIQWPAGRLAVACVLALLVGCGQSAEQPEQSAGSEVSAPPVMTDRQMQQWATSCALCHASGVAGAPVVGNAEQWQPRLAQGRDVLLTHTLEGLNSMPPLGYCMSCETEDFVAMINFMVGGTQ